MKDPAIEYLEQERRLDQFMIVILLVIASILFFMYVGVPPICGCLYHAP